VDVHVTRRKHVKPARAARPRLRRTLRHPARRAARPRGETGGSGRAGDDAARRPVAQCGGRCGESGPSRDTEERRGTVREGHRCAGCGAITPYGFSQLSLRRGSSAPRAPPVAEVPGCRRVRPASSQYHRPVQKVVDSVARVVATAFGSGYSPFAPGRGVGRGPSAVWPMAALPWPWLLAASAVLFVAGSLAAGRVARRVGLKDPGIVVVDEVVGQWVTLTALPFTPLTAALGFLLFRAMDIVKPWPGADLERVRAAGASWPTTWRPGLRAPAAARVPLRLAGRVAGEGRDPGGRQRAARSPAGRDETPSGSPSACSTRDRGLGAGTLADDWRSSSRRSARRSRAPTSSSPPGPRPTADDLTREAAARRSGAGCAASPSSSRPCARASPATAGRCPRPTRSRRTSSRGRGPAQRSRHRAGQLLEHEAACSSCSPAPRAR